MREAYGNENTGMKYLKHYEAKERRKHSNRTLVDSN